MDKDLIIKIILLIAAMNVALMPFDLHFITAGTPNTYEQIGAGIIGLIAVWQIYTTWIKR